MAANNNRIYPNKKRLEFDGGLNSKYDKDLLPDNESPSCLNVIFDQGAVETRGGLTVASTNSVGSFPCDGIFTRTDNDGANQTMVAWFNGNFYDFDGTTLTTVPSGQSVYTANLRITAAEYENYMFFGNGSGRPYEYGGDGDTFTRHAIETPTQAVGGIATAATGTALTGDFQYKVTYVNSNLVESDVSDATATFTASSENIALTSIPIAAQSFGVNSRRLYRTENGGTTFKRLATLNDNTTTSYDDAIADSALGVTAPTDNGTPGNYSAIIYHQARMFIIDPADNLVKYSEIGNPYTFASTSFLRIGDNSADIPVGFEIYDNSIVVFCKNNPWIIYMPSTTDTDWRVLRVRANYGSHSPFGSFKYNSKVMYPAVQNGKMVGFAAISGQTVSPSASLLTSTALGSELQSERIEPDIFGINEGKLSEITSIVYKNKAYISFPNGTSQLTNNRILVFDFSLGSLRKKQEASWAPWDNMNARDFTILDGDLYHGESSSTGQIQQMNTTTYNDNGSAIDSYFWTKEYSGLGGDESHHKDFRFSQMFVEASGAYFMDFTARVDSDSGAGNTTTIDLDPEGSLWGTMEWGTDDWSAGKDAKEVRMFLSPSSGKRIQFKFSNQNTANQKFKVIGMNFVYNNKGLR
jgi:hypothetical protein